MVTVQTIPDLKVSVGMVSSTAPKVGEDFVKIAELILENLKKEKNKLDSSKIEPVIVGLHKTEKIENLKMAYKLLLESHKAGHRFNLETIECTIIGLHKQNLFQEAALLLEETTAALPELKPETIAVTVFMLQDTNCFEEAFSLYKTAIENWVQFPENLIEGTVLGFIRGKCLNAARDSVLMALEAGLILKKREAIECTAIELKRKKKFADAYLVLKTALEKGIRPTDGTINATVIDLRRARYYNESNDLYRIAIAKDYKI